MTQIRLKSTAEKIHNNSASFCDSVTNIFSHPLGCVAAKLHYANCLLYSKLYTTSGLLKLRVATCKWVPETSHVGCENAISKRIIMVITSLSLPTNKMGLLYNYFTSTN